MTDLHALTALDQTHDPMTQIEPARYRVKTISPTCHKVFKGDEVVHECYSRAWAEAHAEEWNSEQGTL